MGTPVEEDVPGPAALDLQREFLAVAGSIEQRLAQLPVGADLVVLPLVLEVVYVVSEDKARQVIVRIGERKDGMAEILSGLSGPETVAVDGAAYLSDGAAVRTVKSAP